MINAECVVKLYKEKGLTFGFAESLTGGMISSEIVGVPGASEVFSGSVVCYTNDVKINVLGVPETVIGEHTEVSAECAEAMAEGLCKVIGCDTSVAVTGIAGPTGELPGKPVGTVYFGFHTGGKNGSFRRNFSGSRLEVREMTAQCALETLIKIAEGKI